VLKDITQIRRTALQTLIWHNVTDLAPEDYVAKKTAIIITFYTIVLCL